MKRAASSSDVQVRPDQVCLSKEQGITPLPPIDGYSTRDLEKPRRPALALVVGLAICLTVGLLVGLLARGWNAPPGKEAPPVRVVSDDERLCGQFMKLKNAADAKADDLLGRVPGVTEEALPEDEVQRLQTDFFLRENIQVLSVTAEGNRRANVPAGCFVLATRGNVAAPILNQKTANGVERSQRTMANPDLIVQVRDGKIYGVRAELHMGP
jgi:hypothetical protein